MKVRSGSPERHFPWRWVAAGVAGAAAVTAAGAIGAEVRPLGNFLLSSDRSPSTRRRVGRSQPTIPHERLQRADQQVHIRAYGHSMLHVDGKEAEEGTERERSVDFHLASILRDLYPNLTVTHDNSAVIGSLSTDLLQKLQADREELINFPGIMIHVVYTGENDWRDVLISGKSMQQLEGLSGLSEDLPPATFIREAVTNGIPINHSHRGVEKKLNKTKLAIFKEYQTINAARRKKGFEPIYVAALESADFSKAKAITMYPLDGVDVKPTVFPLVDENGKPIVYAQKGARLVSETNTQATQKAVGRYRRSVPVTLVPIRGVEAHFGFDQHVGEPGQEFMAFQVIYALNLIPESAITDVA